MPQAALIALLLLLTLTTTSSAQAAPPAVWRPQPSLILSAVPRGRLQQPLALDSVRQRIRPTHWKEGAFIGGLTTGLGLALFAESLCRSSESSANCAGAVTGAFMLGGVMGGVVGALIGGQFAKAPGD